MLWIDDVLGGWECIIETVAQRSSWPDSRVERAKLRIAPANGIQSPKKTAIRQEASGGPAREERWRHFYYAWLWKPQHSLRQLVSNFSFIPAHLYNTSYEANNSKFTRLKSISESNVIFVDVAVKNTRRKRFSYTTTTVWRMCRSANFVACPFQRLSLQTTLSRWRVPLSWPKQQPAKVTSNDSFKCNNTVLTYLDSETLLIRRTLYFTSQLKQTT